MNKKKKLILIIAAAAMIVTSCTMQKSKSCTYQKGETVIVQPGSIEGVIISAWNCNWNNERYSVQYADNYGIIQEINIEIFQIKNK